MPCAGRYLKTKTSLPEVEEQNKDMGKESSLSGRGTGQGGWTAHGIPPASSPGPGSVVFFDLASS